MDVELASARAADFNVYWGDGGKVDSVIDVTHDVAVPFNIAAGASWGFLNQARPRLGRRSTPGRADDRRHGVRRAVAVFCLAGPGSAMACTAVAYALSKTAIPGPVAYQIGGPTTVHDHAGGWPGFIMYLPGHYLHLRAPRAAPAGHGRSGRCGATSASISAGTATRGDQGRLQLQVGTSVRSPRSAPRYGLAQRRPTRWRRHSTRPAAGAHGAGSVLRHQRVRAEPRTHKIIKFVNLPADAIIRIYSSSGVLVALLEHHSATASAGTRDWNVRNRNNQVVASGVYFYHVEAGDARRVGRFTVVNFAQ